MACLVCHDVYTRAFERAGGRVVEGARLERVYGCKPIEGSNPSLSASSIDFILFFNNLKIEPPRTHTGTHIYFLKNRSLGHEPCSELPDGGSRRPRNQP